MLGKGQIKENTSKQLRLQNLSEKQLSETNVPASFKQATWSTKSELYKIKRKNFKHCNIDDIDKENNK